MTSTSFSRRVDDRTDDCACGAMMLLYLRPKFRKLRFQMIADTVLAIQTPDQLHIDLPSASGFQ